MEFKKIHLYGSDIEDYEVLSALIQDAAIPTSEMKFDKVEKKFFLVCSRFSWESRLQNKDNKRVVSGICFDNVIEVKKKNFPSPQKSPFSIFKCWSWCSLTARSMSP